MSLSAWLGIAAFAVVVLELVAAGIGVHLVRKFWRRAEPQVRPLLAMFTPPPAPPANVEPDERLPLP